MIADEFRGLPFGGLTLEHHQGQHSNKTAGGRLCFVAYQGLGSEAPPSANQRVLLIAILDASDHLSILVDPAWPDFVSSEDLEYLESLLEDLKPRALLDARGLFVQLTTLNLGPVVTSEVKSINDLNDLRNEIPSHFAELV
jgi:hypothetical protein